MGQRVRFPSNGSTVEGYLATDEGAGPGLIVIHEWGGLVPHIEDVCERFAAEGFTALAPGLTDEAHKDDLALDMLNAAQHLSGAIDYMVEHPAVRGHGVGVVGFSLGGGLALWLASLRPDQVRAVVPFYGPVRSSEGHPDWARIEAAVEGHYGEQDDWATPDAARDIQQALEAEGKEVRLFIYPNVGHAFFDDTRREAYDEDSARQAWVRTLEFLRAKLG